ncbi:ECF transporter S component [uncultured Phocaeicola sp.]|uniref:ECF transporter S component n=1 Tax=uncultured Phocaeicola sp. TaxID=990718 RepID=UPI0025CCD21D|nr:ECF transporter S component [uncultured Phocaeicola sp.]
MESTARLYALKYTDVNTYLFALLFVVANVLFPQLCHLMYLGGPTWLPIYFFTLIGAYKYGVRVGLLTAVLSPILNSWLFGMPALAVLPAILVKSVLLALGAGYVAQRTKRVTLLSLLAVVLFYQAAGSLAEWGMTGSFVAAMQDFRMGVPGMLLQLFGGYGLLKLLARKG